GGIEQLQAQGHANRVVGGKDDGDITGRLGQRLLLRLAQAGGADHQLLAGSAARLDIALGGLGDGEVDEHVGGVDHLVDAGRLHCLDQGTAHAAGSTENTYFHEYILPLIACPGCFAVQAEPHACTAKHPGQACTAEKRESVPACVAQFTRNGRLTTLYRLASFFSMNLRRLRSNLSKLMPDSRQALTSCKRLRAYST